MTGNEWIFYIGAIVALWFLSSISFKLLQLFKLWIQFQIQKIKIKLDSYSLIALYYSMIKKEENNEVK